MRAAETAIWNDYWHFDRLSSFDDAGPTNYAQEIAAGWQAFFEALPDGAAILDLCTGNGAIAVMAAAAARRARKSFRIAAVDAADVNPYRHVKQHRDDLAAIDFRPATPIERLPWPAASFDAVVSQYGIEYSDLSLSVPELARVIAPGGKVRLVVHAAEGPVVQRSARVVPEIDFLLHDIDLAGAAQRCLRAVAVVERSLNHSLPAQAAARDSVAAFQHALRETARRAPIAADRALLAEAGETLTLLYQRRRQYDVATAIGLVEEIRTEWRHHRARLVAQIDAAITREGRADLVLRLKALGARQVSEADQAGPDGLMGHCIEASF
ncbi:class I SAM-dependent methyltransferase [Sphingoaurantiacus capsulatus]|uniref:Class I SAM-dependent methyltransferase n=1 Tax=Sphingoaurantiacus capsulatus TaxID=1771310 RepID=A0ABV7XE49_9SPHN